MTKKKDVLIFQFSVFIILIIMIKIVGVGVEEIVGVICCCCLSGLVGNSGSYLSHDSIMGSEREIFLYFWTNYIC